MRWAAASIAAALVLLAASPPAAAQKEYRVRVVTEPEGAEIRIDDPDADPVGTSPWNGTLPAGPYMLIVDLDGHEQLIEEIIVNKSRKRQTFELTLRKIKKGTLAIAGDGDAVGAAIKIDGKEVGEVPHEVEIAEGPHEVLVSKKGFKRFEQWVEIASGNTTEVEVELESEGGDEVPVEVVADKPAPSAPRQAPLVVGTAALEVAWRRWDYLNPRSASARPFDANLVPMLRAGVEVYPMAGSGTAALRGAGVRLGVGLGLPPAADTGGMETIPTSWSELEVSALYQHAVSAGARARIEAGYARNAFGFDAGALANEVPDADYRCLRLAAGVELGSGKLRVALGGSYFALLDAGAVALRFRTWSSQGLGVEAGAWYPVTSAVRAGMWINYRRYAFDFGSEPGDQVEADGGTDIYVGTTVGASYSY